MELILCDANLELANAWRWEFRGLEVHVEYGDYFDIEVDAYVSPANSYGYMDGGFDLLLRNRFPGIQESVQLKIGEFGGQLPVGHTVVVETEDPFVPYLVCAPTMKVPSQVAQTRNAYLAMRAILKAVDEHGSISSVAIPGLCTGIGQMDPAEAAAQMAAAYQIHFGA